MCAILTWRELKYTLEEEAYDVMICLFYFYGERNTFFYGKVLFVKIFTTVFFRENSKPGKYVFSVLHA